MKKKIIILILFIISIFIFDRFFLFFLQNWEKHFYRNKSFREDYLGSSGYNYDMLIMGSSRTKRGIFPYYFYNYAKLKAKNIAGNVRSAKFNYYFYRKYRQYVKAPKIVIYGIDYFIFKLNTNPKWMQYFKGKEQFSTIKTEGILTLITNKEQIDVFINNLIKRFNEKIVNKFKPNKKNPPTIDDFIGFKGKIRSNRFGLTPFKKIKYKGFPGLEGYYFKKLLEELYKDRVTVVLVYIPDYIGTYKTNFQKKLLRKDIGKLSKLFNNIHILDYNDPSKFPLSNKNFFIDGDYGSTNSHLSIQGAKKFNRMLIRDILRILRGKNR